MSEQLTVEVTSLSDLPSLKDSILADILTGPPPVGFDEHLEGRRKTGFSYMSLSMAGDAGGPSSTYAHIAAKRQSLSQKPWVALVDSVADIRKAKSEGKLAIDFHFQGTEAVGRYLAIVGALYKLGVRWMLMAYNFHNNVGTGCIEG
jgi:membrane dipeptidase